MSYLATRLRSTARHLLSLRGILLTVAGAAAALSVLMNGWFLKALGLLAVASLAVLLLLMSLRQSEHHAHISDLRRRQQRASTPTNRNQVATPGPSPVRYIGPNDDTRHGDRVSRARAKILSVRGAVAATAAPYAQGSDVTTSSPEVLEPGPTITVVVPCYNEARFVGATLESLRRQSFGDWECIVVDDASTDDSVAEAHRFSKVDERFRLIRHKVNGGLSAARNTGLRMARGRYITFLDSDDMLMSDSLLDRLETLAAADHAVAGAFCGMRIAPEDVTLDSLPAHEDWGNPRYVDFVSAAAECPFNAHAPLLRTDVVRTAGGFDEAMRDGAEDWDLWLRILRRGFGFVPSRWTTAIYRQKQQSMAKTGAKQHVLEAQRLIARSYEHDPAFADDPDAPHSFPLPLPAYQQQLVLARRALQYAATSIARGDPAAAEAILTANGTIVEPWMDRHIDIDSVIRSGFRRAFGLNEREVSELAEELGPLNLQVRKLIEAQPPPPAAEPADRQMRRYDTLFAPADAAQANTMIAAATKLPSTHSVAFLNVERVSGAQGVAEAVASTSYPAFSVNEWVLGGYCHGRIVVSFPRDAAIEELLGATLASDGEAVEVVMDGTDVMLVDGSPDYGYVLPRTDGSSLATLLTKRDSPTRFVTVVGSQNCAMLWHGASDPDPDEAWRVEEYPDTRFDASAIERFKGIHRGQRCVIIGNGPSLNQLDLRKLKDEYTIGVNGIFYAAERMGFDPSYYVVEDTMVMRDNVEAIKEYRAGHKFFPSIYRSQVGEAPNVSYFMMNRGYYASTSPAFCVPRFSTDATQRLYSGQSVTIINLQLAYYMGFSEVVLIGMDFSYTVPDDAEVEGTLITSMGDDPNHFHPDYFGKGKIWKDPKLDRVLANYQLAKLMYEADGRRIVNATAGGKLDLFERVSYDELFG